VALALTALILGVQGQMETASLQARLTGIPIVLAITWALAAVSYVLVFKPSQRLKPLLVPHAAPRKSVPGGEREAPVAPAMGG
jgi:hypothetical protein